MALRQNAPAFEYFQPSYEWADEREANILYIYVPGFKREHLKIMYVHTSRTIKVEGEKSLGNNRWSKFSRTFPVPNNSEVTKIQAKFQHGILTITLPKTIVRPPSPPKQEVKTNPPEPQRASPPSPKAPAAPKQEAKPTRHEAARVPPTLKTPIVPPALKTTAQEAATTPGVPPIPKHDVKTSPQEAARVPPTAKIPEVPQAPKQEVTTTPREGSPPKVSSANSLKENGYKDISSTRHPEVAASNHSNMQKDQAPKAPRKPSLGTDTGRSVDEKMSGASREAAVGKKNAMDNAHVMENGVSKKFKESTVGSASHKVSEKVEGEKPFVVAQEKSSAREFVAISFNGIRKYAVGTKQAALSFAKMLKQEDENRQLMVNVGVASLSIMALGAYISYSLVRKE